MRLRRPNHLILCFEPTNTLIDWFKCIIVSFEPFQFLHRSWIVRENIRYKWFEYMVQVWFSIRIIILTFTFEAFYSLITFTSSSLSFFDSIIKHHGTFQFNSISGIWKYSECNAFIMKIWIEWSQSSYFVCLYHIVIFYGLFHLLASNLSIFFSVIFLLDVHISWSNAHHVINCQFGTVFSTLHIWSSY